MIPLRILFCALSVATASAVSAATINFDAASSSVPMGPGYSFSATGGSVVMATKNGVSFVGVSGGSAGTEIDFGQSLDLSFTQSVSLHSLSVGLLFNGPEYRDHNEIALISTNTGAQYRLHVIGENAARWSYWNAGDWDWIKDVTGEGTVFGGKGLFTVADPFMGSAVTGVSFKAGMAGSDYGLAKFATMEVPDHGTTLALLGASLVAVAGFRRYSRR